MSEWKKMDFAPRDGTAFLAVDISRYPVIEWANIYKWEGHPNYWNCRRHGICIRPEYQDRYRWVPLPVIETLSEPQSSTPPSSL